MTTKHRVFPLCVAALFVMRWAGVSPAAYGGLKVPERGFISSEPAQTWEQGLICGNGTIGANMFSRPLDETIIFTHERLFLPMGAPTMPPDTSSRLFEIRLENHWKRSGFMSFGLVQLGQAATSLGENELAYECLKHMVNRFWLGNLASMHNHRSLFNMDISGGMPAVLIRMLVASDPGRIQ